ncbi:MAG: sterol desaturase family protein [Bacteroidia bacterium]|nr:sterol desaturase family protein [Bacteroidia bacterium]
MYPEFLNKDYTVSTEFIYLAIVLAVFVFGRYLILSGLYQKLIYDRLSKVLSNRIISPKYPRDQQIREIMWSGIGSIIFGLMGVVMIMGWQKGYTQIYSDFSTYPLWYLPISLVVGMVLHETYYYWLHRWMHHSRGIYKLIHKVHHDSVSTSVWTSFSFHPLESLLQAIIIPVIIMIIPMHWVVLLVWLILMTLSAIINHAGVEIFPKAWRDNAVMKWLIGSTHHDIHHRRFTKNFGLYFTFWDIWMGTESHEFDQRWNKATAKA